MLILFNVLNVTQCGECYFLEMIQAVKKPDLHTLSIYKEYEVYHDSMTNGIRV